MKVRSRWGNYQLSIKQLSILLTKRIIPCLDIKDGRTVKGINFESIRDAGDPVELAMLYSEQGADELVFLDITATVEKRKTLVELVKRIAANINIPFTVGGGISSVEDVSVLLQNGADKISINTSAFKNLQLINDLEVATSIEAINSIMEKQFEPNTSFLTDAQIDEVSALFERKSAELTP